MLSSASNTHSSLSSLSSSSASASASASSSSSMCSSFAPPSTLIAHELVHKPRQLTNIEERQISRIKHEFSRKNGPNLENLRILARRGFVTNEWRCKIWPIFLGISSDSLSTNDSSSSSTTATTSTNISLSLSSPSSSSSTTTTTTINTNNIPTSNTITTKNAEQIKKDIARSMYQLDVTKHYDEKTRSQEQKVLQNILQNIFVKKNSNLHYIQGFHDIASIFYIVGGESLGEQMTEAIAKRHLRDAVREDLNSFQSILQFVYPLLQRLDPELVEFLQKADVSPIFTLPWVLTWYSHNLDSFNDIVNLYDFFIVSHPLMPIYFTVAFMYSCRNELLKHCDSDASVFSFFKMALSNDWNKKEYLEDSFIIEESCKLFKYYPPSFLYTKFIDYNSIPLPNDSPFLAQTMDEIHDMNPEYSGSHLKTSLWNYKNPRFWSYVALPLTGITAAGYCISTWPK